ncbi:MAG: OmpH family outer membrane protein [Pseudomonadota bacterium]
MKKFALAVAVAMIVAGAAQVAKASNDKAGGEAAASTGNKFGYVDLNRALNEVAEGKAAKAKLEADGKAKKQKLEIMQNDLKKMKEDLDKQRLILSADAMKEKEGQFQQKFMELQKTSNEFAQTFADAEASAIKPISEKMQKVIQQIGASEGYTMIVPREMALYSPAGADLTERVITAYNSGKGK